MLVVEAGKPHNATAGHAHNYLCARGATARLLADGRAELASYGGQVLTGRVTAITPPHAEQARGTGGDAGESRKSRFLVGLADSRRVFARRRLLLLAAGLTDELPAVPGLAPR